MSSDRSSKFSWRSGLSPQARGTVAINLAAVIFGTAALYGKLDVSPFWITAIRAGFGALALALLGGFTSRLLALPLRSWGVLGLSGFLLAAHWLTFFMSVQLSGVAVATLTFATFPLFTVIVEAARQRRLPRPAELLVGVVIIVAVALLTGSDSADGNPVGVAAGLVSALVYALFWQVTQRLDEPLSPATVSLCQSGIVFVLLIPGLFFTSGPTHSTEWLALAALGVFNTAVMLLLYLYALKHISASTCSGFVALEPIYAITFAAWLFHEPVTPWIFVSIVLILSASLTLLRIEKQRKGH